MNGNDKLFSVADKVVLLSGASRGIGYAIAAAFAERGATVIVTGRDRKTLDEAQRELAVGGGNVGTSVCDVADAAAIGRCVKDVLDRYGHIDTLINVAGVNRRKPAADVTPEDFDFILDINLRGAFLMSQAVGRHMIERHSGCQINIDSLNTYAPLTRVVPYAMSKAGLGMMTRGLATEWGRHGVRVNGIAPGFILTDLTRKLWSSPVMQAWGTKNTPAGRIGEVGDLVGTALFLASPASAFMTGQILRVDGGFSAGVQWPIDEA